MTQENEARTILIAGGSGLIGTALVKALLERGDHVIVLSRSESRSMDLHPNLSESRWDPASGVLNQAVVDRAHVVVNLSGASIGAKRWNAQYKRTILESRTSSTALLAQAIKDSPTPPQVLLQGSASGYYGESSSVADETSPLGTTFLAKVCAKWEKAASPAMVAGTRVAYIRTSTVMTPEDGALKKVLLPMKFMVGGPLGSGDQTWSWIALEDQVRAMLFVMDTPEVHGPVNLVAPANATNAELTRAIAKKLGKPSFFKVPAFVLRLVLGEFAEEILMDQKIAPKILDDLGFTFNQPNVEALATYVAEELRK